jgi:hypothetical protein
MYQARSPWRPKRVKLIIKTNLLLVVLDGYLITNTYYFILDREKDDDEDDPK